MHALAPTLSQRERGLRLPSFRGKSDVSQQVFANSNLSDQSTGGARHGGRMAASATDGIEIVKNTLESISACERSDSATAQNGIAARANSQSVQVSSGIG